ncbi:hypothetical protein ACFFK0_11690 [Paenibacillus chartarius]|uniref:Uncharacterized protein n=1 Tax=Paenibacillus chartarius TaxID=747481 RepID=A0ABV6DKC7_9BACL
MFRTGTFTGAAAAVALWLTVAASGNAAAVTNAAGAAGADHPDRDAVVLSVRASRTASYETREERKDSGLRQALEEAVRADADAAPPAHVRAELLDTFVAWPGTNGSYGIDDDGTVVDAAKGVRLRTPEKWRRELSAARESLRARHYGALLPWSEARSAVPRMAKFDVIDVETGLAFRAQRRAGSSHADAQPLTRQDSETMKRIYGGSWSWDRRAVVLRYNDKLYAASMNGKPHGGDGIPDNGFSGHFCIHFAGSTTHGKANLDLAHQTMAHKAAGLLGPYLTALDPERMAELFIIAYNQHDEQLLQAVSSERDWHLLLPDKFHESRIQLIRREDELPKSSSIRSDRQQTESTVVVGAGLYREDSRTAQRATLTFHLIHIPFYDGWQIQRIDL